MYWGGEQGAYVKLEDVYSEGWIRGLRGSVSAVCVGGEFVKL